MHRSFAGILAYGAMLFDYGWAWNHAAVNMEHLSMEHRIGSKSVHIVAGVIGSDAQTRVDLATNARLKAQVLGLENIESDLEADEQAESTELAQTEHEIARLVHKRDELKRAKAQRVRDVAFISSEVAELQKRVHITGTANASEASLASAMNVAAIEGATSAVETVAALSTDVGVASAEAEHLDAHKVADAGAAMTSNQQASTVQALQAKAAAESKARVEAEARARAATEALEAERRAEKEAKARAEAEAKAKADMEALEVAHRQQAAAEAEKAEVEAKKQKTLEAQRAKLQAKREMEEEAARKAQEARRHREDMADHADDSFKQYMKEEDGEDQQNDPDYEASASALADATGWDRHEIESKADSAVKQLTEAIGGKKVVQSLQGMMSGIR